MALTHFTTSLYMCLTLGWKSSYKWAKRCTYIWCEGTASCWKMFAGLDTIGWSIECHTVNLYKWFSNGQKGMRTRWNTRCKIVTTKSYSIGSNWTNWYTFKAHYHRMIRQAWHSLYRITCPLDTQSRQGLTRWPTVHHTITPDHMVSTQ